ncbi:hypothetical protein BAUCODRAFT_246027 [Baudoinia panamericana UAMH 10762]|uniref:Uncharacterized protein n=1 Tax=Baudoinia panamericana (strain UAMH 10762) TaxID=717646 RepID=M2N3J8_BAUPA|nr:uncharacterized protein BAUCODRAFT_246027 [Baudoinia panamericana UAMH 10762]EMC93574.1 hypothetical protein BAUCODRAFT_246027 [Baudoinia panamericana UAMH 10762]
MQVAMNVNGSREPDSRVGLRLGPASTTSGRSVPTHCSSIISTQQTAGPMRRTDLRVAACNVMNSPDASPAELHKLSKSWAFHLLPTWSEGAPPCMKDAA